MNEPVATTCTEPYPIKVTRWVCGGWTCTRSSSKRETVEGHMQTCWRVPENRTCLTCRNFEMRTCCWGPTPECGCRGEREWACRVDISIAPGKPQVGCPSWVSAIGSDIGRTAP